MHIPVIQGCMYVIDWGTCGVLSLVNCTALDISSCHCILLYFQACALRQGLVNLVN